MAERADAAEGSGAGSNVDPRVSDSIHFDLRLYVLVGPPQAAPPAAQPAAEPATSLDEFGPEPPRDEVAALVSLARAAIEGGATMLQLRAKDRPTRDLVAFARALLPITRPAGVPLLINDRADVAAAVGADGVHLGPGDLAVEAARTLLGPSAIIGYSAGSPAEAAPAARRGASYLGTGDVFGTRTKPDADAPIGLHGLAAVARATALPIVAIGGVNESNAPDAIAAGASGVAVVSAITGAPDPAAAARALRAAVDAAIGARGEAGVTNATATMAVAASTGPAPYASAGSTSTATSIQTPDSTNHSSTTL